MRALRAKADFIVSPQDNGYHCLRMIKALFLIFDPVTAWVRVLESRRSLRFVFIAYLLPMLLLVAVTGGFGLVKWGKWQSGIGQYKKFTVNEAVVYQTGELLLMLVVIAVCAHLIKLLGETFNGRHTYPQAFKGFRIIAQGVDLSLELFGNGVFLFQLAFQNKNPCPHPFVLLDERQVRHHDEHQDGEDHEADDHLP